MIYQRLSISKKSIIAVFTTATIIFLYLLSCLFSTDTVIPAPSEDETRVFVVAPTISCSMESLGTNWDCLKLELKKRSESHGNLIVVGVNSAFYDIAMNLVCSAEKAGIHRDRFVMWANDHGVHQTMVESQFLSIFNPVMFQEHDKEEHISESGTTSGFSHLTAQRASFWYFMMFLDIPFWWIDADAVIHGNIDKLLSKPKAELSDLIFCLDTNKYFDEKERIDRFRFEKEDGNITSHLWADANSGFFFAKPTNGTKRYFKELFNTAAHDKLDQQWINDVLVKNTGNTSEKWIHYVDDSVTPQIMPNHLYFSFFDLEQVQNGRVAILGGKDGLLNRTNARLNGQILLTHANSHPDKNKFWKVECLLCTSEQYWGSNCVTNQNESISN